MSQDLENTFLQALEQNQQKLLRILLFLFILGPGVTPERPPQIIKMSVLISGVGIGTYFLNKRAVRKELIPRLEKIDELIRVLESS